MPISQSIVHTYATAVLEPVPSTDSKTASVLVVRQLQLPVTVQALQENPELDDIFE